MIQLIGPVLVSLIVGFMGSEFSRDRDLVFQFRVNYLLECVNFGSDRMFGRIVMVLRVRDLRVRDLSDTRVDH